MEFKENFGVRIKELRNKKKLTQAKLSELVGIDAKHMSHIETGRSFPKADLIEKLSRELDTDISTMFDFPKSRTKKDLLKEIQAKLKNAEESDVLRLYRIIVSYLK